MSEDNNITAKKRKVDPPDKDNDIQDLELPYVLDRIKALQKKTRFYY